MPVMTEFICPKQYCSNIRIVLKLDTIAHSCRRLGCSCFVPTCCRLDFQLKKIARLSSQATFCTVCLGLPSSLLQSRDSSQPGLWKFSVETAQHVSKVITWKRSVSSLSSSSRSPFTTSMIKDDAGDSSSDFVEQFSMVSGSHSSTLDRLYAWERKLHDEIKQKTNWKILPPIHQRGRTVEIFNSFELVLDPVSGTLDRAFLEKKQELYKKVFPKFYVLGWYSMGSDVQETDMLIHKALMDINESPVYLLLNPAINLSQKDLPVTIYESGFQVMGVGFTGSLASSRPKHGDHRFYMSTRTQNCLRTSNVTFLKTQAQGLQSREEEDRISSHFLLKAIADACVVSATIKSDIQEPEISKESLEQFDEDQELQQVIDGQVHMKIYHFSDPVEKNFNRKIILSGSFNPLHDGHLRLLEVASSMCDDGLPCFEISAINADKPPLTIEEIRHRVEQFRKAGKTVIISNQPYFYKKAELFPGSAFIIGADTAARLVNPKYYGGDYNRMLEILLECKRTGSTFLVGGRNIDGVFKVLEDLDIPGELRDMFISIPEDKFRMDISSTEIRKSKGL